MRNMKHGFVVRIDHKTTYNFRIFYRNQRLYFALRNTSYKYVHFVEYIFIRCNSLQFILQFALSIAFISVNFTGCIAVYSIFNYLNSHWTCCIRAIYFNISISPIFRWNRFLILEISKFQLTNGRSSRGVKRLQSKPWPTYPRMTILRCTSFGGQIIICFIL